MDLPAVALMDGRRHECRIFDISPGGARVQLQEGETPPAGKEIELDLEGYGRVPCEVRHSAAGVLGLMFLHDESAEIDFARYLIELKPDRPQVRRQLHLPATLRLVGDELPCIVTNLSSTGVALTLATPRDIAVGDRVELELPSYGLVAAAIRYVEGSAVGLALIEGIDISNVQTAPRVEAGSGNRVSDRVIRRLHRNASGSTARHD